MTDEHQAWMWEDGPEGWSLLTVAVVWCAPVVALTVSVVPIVSSWALAVLVAVMGLGAAVVPPLVVARGTRARVAVRVRRGGLSIRAVDGTAPLEGTLPWSALQVSVDGPTVRLQRRGYPAVFLGGVPEALQAELAPRAGGAVPLPRPTEAR